MVLQSEAAECGLACLAMLADAHGLRTDLRQLRVRFPVSLKGTTLAQLMRWATRLQFAPRALRCELSDLPKLAVPCILHWDFEHFVVLEAAGRRAIAIVDPANGRRSVPLAEASRRFTGVALELVPTTAFAPVDLRHRLRLRDLSGRIVGLGRAILGMVALAAALEAIALAVPLVTQFVVDGALVSGDRDLLTLCVLGGLAMFVVDFVLRVARGRVTLDVNQSLGLQWSANVFSHLMRLPAAFFEKRHLGDITSRFASLATLRTTLTGGSVTAAIDGVFALATLVLMTVYSQPLTAVALVGLASYAALRAAAYPPFRAASEERLVLGARENSFFLESIRAVVPLKQHGRIAERVGRWQNLMVDVQNRDLATQRMSLWFASTHAFIVGVEGMALLGIGGAAVLDRRMSLGMLLAFLAWRVQFGDRAARLIDLAVEVRMMGLHAERLADITRESVEPEPEAEGDTWRVVPRIEVRDVSFRHADGEPWILRHCSLVIEAGESVAVVGASGCGKTTLLKIVLGLLSPTEGEIRIGVSSESTTIRQLGLPAWRALVGTVMQDDVLLSGSLADNIACFDPVPAMADVEAAARLAAVHDEIAAMPMGYRTRVGDMGSTLSGGQKQRVLLARALYRQPRVLALDEATSHLDVDGERRVNAAIRGLAMTRITIAHRPETIAAAERVVVLEGGRIVRDVRVAADASVPLSVEG